MLSGNIGLTLTTRTQHIEHITCLARKKAPQQSDPWLANRLNVLGIATTSKLDYRMENRLPFHPRPKSPHSYPCFWPPSRNSMPINTTNRVARTHKILHKLMVLHTGEKPGHTPTLTTVWRPAHKSWLSGDKNRRLDRHTACQSSTSSTKL